MTTLTDTAPSAERFEAPVTTRRERLSFARLIRAEWIKFTTVRSTWWSLALVAVISIGLSVLQASAISSYAGEPTGLSIVERNEPAVLVIVFATVLTQLLAVIIGTIAVTGEYSTGMIRSTLTAAPRRVGAMLAKALVAGAAMFVFSLIVFAIAGAASGGILPSGPVDFSDPDSSLMPLLGAALYLGLVTILGVGIGFIIRNGPGALALGIGLLFVAPVLVMFFPATPDFEWVHTLAGYLPSNAGQSLFMGSPMSGQALETLPALLTIFAWPVGALAVGVGVLKSRDA